MYVHNKKFQSFGNVQSYFKDYIQTEYSFACNQYTVQKGPCTNQRPID